LNEYFDKTGKRGLEANRAEIEAILAEESLKESV